MRFLFASLPLLLIMGCHGSVDVSDQNYLTHAKNLEKFTCKDRAEFQSLELVLHDVRGGASGFEERPANNLYRILSDWNDAIYARCDRRVLHHCFADTAPDLRSVKKGTELVDVRTGPNLALGIDLVARINVDHLLTPFYVELDRGRFEKTLKCLKLGVMGELPSMDARPSDAVTDPLPHDPEDVTLPSGTDVKAASWSEPVEKEVKAFFGLLNVEQLDLGVQILRFIPKPFGVGNQVWMTVYTRVLIAEPGERAQASAGIYGCRTITAPAGTDASATQSWKTQLHHGPNFASSLTTGLFDMGVRSPRAEWEVWSHTRCFQYDKLWNKERLVDMDIAAHVEMF